MLLEVDALSARRSGIVPTLRRLLLLLCLRQVLEVVHGQKLACASVPRNRGLCLLLVPGLWLVVVLGGTARGRAR
jgi:hypothetical protein